MVQYVYNLWVSLGGHSLGVGNIKIKTVGTCQEERWQSLDNVVGVGCSARQLGKCWRWAGTGTRLGMKLGAPALDKLGTVLW